MKLLRKMTGKNENPFIFENDCFKDKHKAAIGVFLQALFIVFLFVMTSASWAQPAPEEHYNHVVWDKMLNDVRMRYRFSTEYGGFVQVPRFGDSIEALDGERVELQGFFLPADVTGEAFVLSYVPMQMCFFCAGAGIESVIELQPVVTHNIRFRRLKTDDFVVVQGVMRLNRDNPGQLIYVLQEVELLRHIR